MMYVLLLGSSRRPLSRRLNRCDRMIQNEFRDSNGGNMRTFSAVTCTSQCKLRSLRANASLSALIYTFRVSSLTLDCNGVFAIKSYAICVAHIVCFSSSCSLSFCSSTAAMCAAVSSVPSHSLCVRCVGEQSSTASPCDSPLSCSPRWHLMGRLSRTAV